MKKIRIFIVDDSKNFIESANKFLSNEPYIEISGSTTSSIEAIEILQKVKPDLLIIDIAMPEINGFQIVESLKSKSNPPKIIMVTLYDTSEYREKAEMLKVDGFIIKTSFADEIIPAIKKIFMFFDEKSMGDENIKNILIVDDSSTLRKMVKASLKNLKAVSYYEAGNGLEAIEKLSLVNIDLMILDLNMPDMHGIDVLNFMQKHNIFKSIPVIVLTTKSDEESKLEAINAGASLYITKPFLPEKLAKEVESFIGKKT